MSRSEKIVEKVLIVAFLWVALGGGSMIWGADPPKKAAIKPQANGQEKSAAPAGGLPQKRTAVSLPNYRIEPPDIVLLEMLKMVPLTPYRLETYDVLQIRAAGTLVDQPVDGFYLVESEGNVNLGPAYGMARVKGLTIDECKKIILDKLSEKLQQPEVSVQLARTAATQPVTGQYLVGPDGTINLRQYGTVQIAGKTSAEARQAIEKHLAKFFTSPEVSLDLAEYKSQAYYVITEGPTKGDSVIRLPFTGNETVLDALSRLDTLPRMSNSAIWIARPVAEGSQNESILTVDWNAITRHGSSATNYQLLPGDRLMIVEEMTLPESSPGPKKKIPLPKNTRLLD
jgi:polysaccharide biosynthesis/export protein